MGACNIPVDPERLKSCGVRIELVKQFEHYMKEQGVPLEDSLQHLLQFNRTVLHNNYYSKKDRVGRLRRYLAEYYPQREGVYTPEQQREIMARGERKRVYP